MSTRHPLFPSVAAAVIAAAVLLGGCQTPGAKPDGTAAKPNLGPSVTDPHTAAVIQQMEIDYIAAKNSRPTYQHLAEAEKKRKEQEQAEAARKAEAAKQEAAKEPDKKP